MFYSKTFIFFPQNVPPEFTNFSNFPKNASELELEKYLKYVRK